MTENTLKPYVIGLDLGGTNSVFGIVDARGEIKATTAIKTGGYDKVDDYVKASVEALQPIIETVGGIEKIKAMGIGAPNGNFYTGAIEFAPNLAWAHDGVVPLADMFSKALGIPVALTNDANAAALGEMTYGAARGMKNFIDITLGTGVGSGIVINGQMLYGSDGFAGELGHVIMVPGEAGRVCGCGRRGCLETYCSATGVARTAREFLKTSDEPSCSARWIQRRLPLTMSALLPARVMLWPSASTTSLARCWVRLALTSQHSQLLRHSYSSAVSPRQVTS